MAFEMRTAGTIHFGCGKAKEVGAIAAAMGKRALVVTGSHPKRVSSVLSNIGSFSLAHEIFCVSGEPTVTQVQDAVNAAETLGADMVVAIGGGSVLDTGKAIAALIRNPGGILQYLEIIGDGMPLINPSIPVIAIPTTSGTGSEVTRNAVISSPEHRIKVSLRSPFMIPTVAIVDPELSVTLPPQITASTGMDAVVQLTEAFVSIKSNPFTDAICREGLKSAKQSIIQSYQDGDCINARSDMALASLFGGLAFANAGLGAVHGFAGVIGGMFDVAHGALCAGLFPAVMRQNIEALQARQADSLVLEKYRELSMILTGDHTAKLHDCIHWAEMVCSKMNIPALNRYGIESAHIDRIVEDARSTSSMKCNPIMLADAELKKILRRSL